MRTFILSLLVIFSLGCEPLLITTGVAGGYLLSNDAAVGNVATSYRDLWDIATETISIDDSIEIIGLNESKGIVKARFSGANITVVIQSLEPNLQRLKVSARKFLIPKPYIAQDVFFKIVKDFE